MSIDTSSFRWSSASRSDAGRVRKVNEDACLEQSKHGLWAVADGMGGHSLGEFASGLAVQSLMNLPATEDLEERVSLALNRLREVNRHLRTEALRRDVPLIGTTIAALLAAGNLCTCLWAGDSRIYLYRAGRLRQLTRDHNQIEAVRSRPICDLDDTVELPRANFITRALGAEETLHLDRITLELLDEDIFLLCTDGLSNVVTELSIEQALLPCSCRLACDALINMALDRKARDNITAVVVHAVDLSNPDRTILRSR
ncbi:MAG: PP2C family protein-serine/threonine phosphatase [Steroidobacteraceae bacterium]